MSRANPVAVRIRAKDGGYLVTPRDGEPRWFAVFDDAWAWSLPWFGGTYAQFRAEREGNWR